jgi:hypothetical protein
MINSISVAEDVSHRLQVASLTSIGCTNAIRAVLKNPLACNQKPAGSYANTYYRSAGNRYTLVYTWQPKTGALVFIGYVLSAYLYKVLKWPSHSGAPLHL